MEKIKHIKENPLGYEPIGELLLRFALPAVIGMVVNAIYNIVDQIFIGQGVGYLGNAATTIAFPVVTIILAISTLMGAGGSAYAAIKLGEKDKPAAELATGNVFMMSIIFGVVFSILGLIFLDPLITLFGARENTMEYARQYTSIILMAAPFNVIGISMSNLARTDGKPLLSMISIVAGAVLNIILDPIFIFIFKWGVWGAAVATAVSQVVSAVILIDYFMRKSTMKIRRKTLRLSGRMLKNIMILGISSCALHLASTLLNIVLNNSLVTYGNQCEVGGDVALSAIGIVMKISMIIISVCVGIGVGGQPILGFNKGAGLPRRVRKTYFMTLSIATTVTFLGWLMCETIPELVLKLFGDSDATFSAFAARGMRIYLGAMLVAGMQISTTHYFQATGQPLKANILSLLRQIILLIPLILILPRFFGLDGILYAGMWADILTGVIVLFFVITEIRKLNKECRA